MKFHVSFDENSTFPVRNTRSALYFVKSGKKHTFRSGNSSPLFSGGVKTHFLGFSTNPSIIRYRLEGGSVRMSKSVNSGVKRCQNDTFQ